jgi:hypothetical protein
MRMAIEAWLCAALVLGCSAPAEPITPAGSDAVSSGDERSSRCELRGETMLWAGGGLFADAKGGRRVVDFIGATVDVEVRAFPPSRGERVPVVLRTGGLALDGFVEPYELQLYLRRDTSVIEDAVVLASGARVRVVGSESSSVRVTAELTDFAEVNARVRCRDLSFDEPASQARADQGAPFHLRDARVAIHRDADGPVMGELVARAGTTLYALEQRGELVRVTYDHGVRIDAWVPLAALVAGEGPGCDDCYTASLGDSLDRCPEEEVSPEREIESGCPDADVPTPRERPATGSPIHLEPDDSGPVVGRTEPGAEVYVHERRGAWSRIHGKGWSVMTPLSSGLWMKSE